MKQSIRIETAETGRVSMEYFRFGEGQEIFVILPGLSLKSVMKSADAVAAAYQDMAEQYTIYVFDPRKDLPETYSINEMAEDTAEVLKTLGLTEVNLFGASMGGMAAMKITIGHPELVKKLVLGSTTARITEKQYQGIAEWIRLAEEKRTEELCLTIGKALYPKALFEALRDLFIDMAKTVTDEELSRFIVLAKGIQGHNALNELPGISCPVLVIGDRDDRVLGAEASEEIASRLLGHPDCELFLYEGCGHAAYDVAPDYRERIMRFLDPRTGGSE